MPTPDHLTPADAASALRELLAAAPKRSTPAGQRARGAATFGEACAEWLRYVEHERKRTPSTLADYRSVVRACLLPGFGADTPLGQIDTASIRREGIHGARRHPDDDDLHPPRAAA